MSFNIRQNRTIVNESNKIKRLTNNSEVILQKENKLIYKNHKKEVDEENFKITDFINLFETVHILNNKEKAKEQIKIHCEYNDLARLAILNKYSLFSQTRFFSDWRFDKPFQTFFNKDYFIPHITDIVDKSLKGELSIEDTYGAIVTYYEFYMENLGASAMLNTFGKKKLHKLNLYDIATTIPYIGIKLPPDRSDVQSFSKKYKDGEYYAVNTTNKMHSFMIFDMLGACDHSYSINGVYLNSNYVRDSRIKYMLSTLGLRNCVVEGFYGLRDSKTDAYIPFDKTITPQLKYPKLLQIIDNYPVFEIFDVHQLNNIGTVNEPPFIERYNWIKTYLNGVASKRYTIADIKRVSCKKDFDNATCVVGNNSYVTPKH